MSIEYDASEKAGSCPRNSFGDDATGFEGGCHFAGEGVDYEIVYLWGRGRDMVIHASVGCGVSRACETRR